MAWDDLYERVAARRSSTLAIRSEYITFRPSPDLVSDLGGWWKKPTTVRVALGRDEDAGLLRIFAAQEGWSLRDDGHKSKTPTLRFSKGKDRPPLLGPGMPANLPVTPVDARRVILGDGARVIEFRLPWTKETPSQSGLVAVEPAPKPPEAPMMESAVDGAGSASEAKSRQSAPAAAQPDCPVRQETRAQPGAPVERVEAPQPTPIPTYGYNEPGNWTPEIRERCLEVIARGGSMRELAEINGRPLGSQGVIAQRLRKMLGKPRRLSVPTEEVPSAPPAAVPAPVPQIPDDVLTYLRQHVGPMFRTQDYRLTKSDDGAAVILESRQTGPVRMSPQEAVDRANEMFELEGDEAFALPLQGD